MKQSSLSSFILSSPKKSKSPTSTEPPPSNTKNTKIFCSRGSSHNKENRKKRKREHVPSAESTGNGDGDDMEEQEHRVMAMRKRPRRSAATRRMVVIESSGSSEEESDVSGSDDSDFHVEEEHDDHVDVEDEEALSSSLEEEEDDDEDVIGEEEEEEEEGVGKRKGKKTERKKKKKDGDPVSLSQYVDQLRYNPENSARVLPPDEARHYKFVNVLKDIRDRVLKAEKQGMDVEIDQDFHHDEDEALQDNDDPKGKKTKKHTKKAGSPSKGKLTPLEQQVAALKKKNPGIVLMVEVGYKMRFFAEDADIASKILGVVAYKTHNFLNASIPTYRLNFHLRRLLAAGYKVGIVKQTETSAVKASGETDNKSGPFTRAIHSIYSRGTSILGDDVGDDGEVQHDCGFVMSIVEESMCSSAALKKLKEEQSVESRGSGSGKGAAQHEHIAIVCVNVSTGTIMYDYFEDSFMRRELTTRLTEVEPVEIIMPSCELSKNSEMVISNLVATASGGPVRVERIDDTHYDYTMSRENLTQFYQSASERSNVKDNNGNDKTTTTEGKKQYFEELLENILGLPKPVLVALNSSLQYLKQFRLEELLRVDGVVLQNMNARNRMNLSGITLKNLELLRNNTNNTVDGSLFSILKHTKTPFGLRLLKEWICHPLTKIEDIQERLDAVEEIRNGDAACLDEIADSINRMPDVEKTLMKAWYKKCSPKELLSILRSLKTFYENLPEKELWEDEIKSNLLLSLLDSMPDLTSVIDEFLDLFNHSAAEHSLRSKLFEDIDGVAEKFPEIDRHAKAMNALRRELNTHLHDIRKKVGRDTLEFKCWKNEYNVIELTLAQAKKIQNDKQFCMIHSTKTLTRYHTTFIIEKNQQLLFHKEKLYIASMNAWTQLVDRFASHFNEFKHLVDAISTLDCLYSLAETAKQGGDGYCKPNFTADRHVMKLKDSRHPLIELTLKDRPFVSNSISMNRESGTTAIILSGPNMGGKSSLCRQVALIAIMAQIGSFVPCSKATLPVFDGVFIRAGAQDDIFNAKSTFFVELSETSEILQRSTPSSLIIMDELGRGTSTSDGKSIAYCTIEWLVKHVGCFSLFTTHYPMLFGLERRYPDKVKNYHMGFVAHDESVSSQDGNNAIPRVTFLYKLKKGFADSSYGLNVARLAGLDPKILQEAERKAQEIEREQTFETKIGAFLNLVHALQETTTDKESQLARLAEIQSDTREVMREGEQQKK